MAQRRDPKATMSLGGHLKELRRRFFWVALAVLAGSVAGWYLFDPVFAALQAPVVELAADQHVNATINFGTVGGAFDLRLQIAAFIGVVITSPFWLYQFWAFVLPALKRRERIYTFGFLGAAVPLFLGGCYLAWVSLPTFVRTLIGLTPTGSANVINATEYILFTVRILLVFGISFVLPVVLVFLNFLGLLPARTILKGWRLAVFLAAVIAALATPTADPSSMFYLMVPLLLLYFLAAGVAKLRDSWRLRRQTQQAAELAEDLN